MIYTIAKALVYCVAKVLFFLSAKGTENIPKKGGAVLCANHRTYWDAVLIGVILRRRLAFLSKEELFRKKWLAFLLHHLNCYPVKQGNTDLSVIKTTVSLLREGELVLIFPEGQRVKKGMTPHPKPGALHLAKMGNVPLIPIGIQGNFKAFRKMRVICGAPQLPPPEKRPSNEAYEAALETLMDSIYEMAGGDPRNGN